MRIAVDVMGGDNAPDEIIAGVMESVELLDNDDKLMLVGPEEIVKAQLLSLKSHQTLESALVQDLLLDQIK